MSNRKSANITLVIIEVTCGYVHVHALIERIEGPGTLVIIVVTVATTARGHSFVNSYRHNESTSYTSFIHSLHFWLGIYLTHTNRSSCDRTNYKPTSASNSSTSSEV